MAFCKISKFRKISQTIQKSYYQPTQQSLLIYHVFPIWGKTWGFQNSDLLDDNEVTEIIAGKKSKKHHKSAVGNTEKKTELIWKCTYYMLKSYLREF